MTTGEWTLAELSEESGVAPRTIRYYIARGLLAGPAVAGRGAVYNLAHADRLRQIVKWQNAGLSLSQIGQRLAGPPAATLVTPAAWLRYELAPDVTVSVHAGAAPWRIKQIREALAEFAGRVRVTEESSRESKREE